MIQKLKELVGLREINAKINEFDTEIEDLKRISGTTVTKATLLDFIETNKRLINDAIQNAKNKLDELRNSIDIKLSNYYTKGNSDDRFARDSIKDSFLRSDRDETINNNLNVNGTINLNNTSGPIIQFGNGSWEVRPGYFKMISPDGGVPIEIRNGITYINGQEIVTGVSYISPGEWVELPGSRNTRRVNYSRVYGEDANQMLIVYQYHDGENNGHLYINHILIELSLGQPYYKDAECTINLQSGIINLDWSRDGYNGIIKAVYYR